MIRTTLYGEGQGVTVTHDKERVSWRGSGVGRPRGKGQAMSWRGCIFYSAAPNGKLARLYGIAMAFEHDTEEDGKAESRLFEWK